GCAARGTLGASAGGRAGTGRAARTGRRAGAARTATAKAKTDGTTDANTQATDIARANGRVPSGLELTSPVDRDALVLALVQDDVGVRDTADRAVRVVEHRGPEAPIAVIVVAPLALHRREIHGLRVDEVRARDGVVRAHSEAGEQQV